MTHRRFKQVDVFGDTLFGGNPVAVIIDADGLDAADMQRIARWTNLSETTFLGAATQGGDYRVRIFTPGGELPFAGHPTIGSAHAAIEAGLVAADAATLTQESGIGPVRLAIETDAMSNRVISFELPPADVRRLSASDRAELSRIVGLELSSDDAMVVNVGPVWTIVDMGDADRVHSFQPDFAAIDRWTRRLDMTGITVFGRSTTAPPIYLRSFAPAAGIAEDPVCGSCNGSLAAYLLATGRAREIGDSYQAGQGFEMGRTGRIYVTMDPSTSRVQIGGVARTLVDGRLLT